MSRKKLGGGIALSALLTVMLSGCAADKGVAQAAANETPKPAVSPELIPLTPGEVMIPTGPNELWSFKGADKNCEAVSRYNSPGPIDLRYFSDTGHGEFVFSRSFQNLDCAGFDEFIVTINNDGGGIKARLNVETDVGERCSEDVSVNDDKFNSWTDLRVKLDGARAIKRISVNARYEESGRKGGSVTIFALILRDAAEFAGFRKHWERFSQLQWEGLLRPADYRPAFKLSYGLFFSDEDMERYRESYGKKLAEELKTKTFPTPESYIAPFAFSSQSTRGYIAEDLAAKNGKAMDVLNLNIRQMAFAALAGKDWELTRLTARYALSMATLGTWCDIPLSDTVGGGVWPTFTPSDYAMNLSFALDCAGEALTPQGREYVLKALALKAVGPINYSLWARPFASHSNQGMVFLEGQMAALAVFDKNWRRVGPALKDAKNQADECFDTLFKPDGSYMESFGYLSYTIHVSAPIYEIYARIVGKPLADVLPANVAQSGKYLQALASTCAHPRRKIISVGQTVCWDYSLGVSEAAFMAVAVPDSMWVNMYRGIAPERIDKVLSSDLLGYGVRFAKLRQQAEKAKEGRPEPLVVLGDCGLAASTRRLGSDPVKILMVGDAAGVGKKHHDVGSFVLEFAGDVFAMDMPVYGGLYADAQYHNMLVAVDKDGKLLNSLYFTHPSLYTDNAKRDGMRPVARGDERRFSGEINPSLSWRREHFEKWSRKVESPSPEVVTITDEYKLGAGASGAAFIWLTYLPCAINGGDIVITGDNGGKAVIAIPVGCEAAIDHFSPDPKTLQAMSLPADHQCSRLIIRKPGKPGEEQALTVSARLDGQGGKPPKQ